MRCLFRERVSAQSAESRPAGLRPALQPLGDPALVQSQGHREGARVKAGMASQTLRASSQSGRCWKREVLEAGGPVLWGREGRPGSPADDLGYALQLADESVAAVLQQLADLSMQGTCSYLFKESYVVSEVSAFGDLEACPRSRGDATQRCGETAQAEAVPLGVSGLKAGRAWGTL